MYNKDALLIEPTIQKYYDSFTSKSYGAENNDSDLLMDLYGISPEQKRENRQYWGRELGMLWQLIVVALAKEHCSSEYKPALRIGDNEPCDLIIGQDAIDTKYRIGSGDSGTLKKFKQYGLHLQSMGFRPVFLILRDDNLPSAITAARKGGWTVLSGDEAILYLQEKTGVNIRNVILGFGKKYNL